LSSESVLTTHSDVDIISTLIINKLMINLPDNNVHKISHSKTLRLSKNIPEIKLSHYNLLTAVTYLPYIDLNSYNFSLKGKKSI